MKTLDNSFDDLHFSGQYGFKYRRIGSDLGIDEQREQIQTLTHNAVFFQLEGELNISFGNYKDIVVKPGTLYFLPRGVEISACILGSSIEYIVARLDHDIDKRFIYDNQSALASFDSDSFTFSTLPIREPLKIFLESIKCYSKEQAENKQLQNLKFIELYLIFSSYYTKNERINLFYLALKSSSKFKTYILDNYNVSTTIEELSKKANMSRSTFDRNFKENFGMTPHKWIDLQTRAIILRKAAEPNVSIKDIMYEIGVYNPSQFTQLCKRLCGVNPSQLVRH